jgi:hypothetical protein
MSMAVSHAQALAHASSSGERLWVAPACLEAERTVRGVSRLQYQRGRNRVSDPRRGAGGDSTSALTEAGREQPNIQEIRVGRDEPTQPYKS